MKKRTTEAADAPVAIVTGGGAGIGRACVQRFAREGYRVVIADCAEEDGKQTCEDLTAAGNDALFVPVDVSREADCLKMARVARERWGRIDTLVANAGARVYGTLLEATDEDWDTILGVNLKGVAYSCRAVLPAMIQQHAGAIVIVSSSMAIVGRSDMPLYDATKAGVLSLTRSLAVTHGPDGIRVNAVCPGTTITDFHIRKAKQRGVSEAEIWKQHEGHGLLGRPARPDQIASAIYFLTSEDASHMTGQTLIVDGGRSVLAGRR